MLRRIENLESREMMAADVMLGLVDGTLTIDSTQTDTQWEGEHAAYVVTISGKADDWGQPTSYAVQVVDPVGGISRETFDASDVKNVKVLMEDTLNIISVRNVIADDMEIRTGANLDHIDIVTSNVNDLLVNTGDGTDNLRANVVTVRNLASISLGSGDDVAAFGNGTVKDMRIRAEAGNDAVVVYRSDIQSNLRFMGDDGNDVFQMTASTNNGATTVLGGAGDDNVMLRQNDMQSVRVFLGDGNDMGMIASSTAKDIAFGGNAGNDTLYIKKTEVQESTRMIGGHGDDWIMARGNDFNGPARLLGNGGNDRISTDLNLFAKGGAIYGGGGYDTLNNRFGNSNVKLQAVDTAIERISNEVFSYFSVEDKIRNPFKA